MNNKIDNFPKEKKGEPRKEFFGFEVAKKELEFLGQQISKLGENKKLLEFWNELPKKIDAGEGKRVLSFLETLQFQTGENVEAWRKAVFGISNMVMFDIQKLSKEEVDNFIKEEFSQIDHESKRDLDHATEQQKLEIVEEEIRKLYSHREFLKKEIADKEGGSLTKKQQRQFNKDKKDMANLIAELLVYRRIRDKLYENHFQS